MLRSDLRSGRFMDVARTKLEEKGVKGCRNTEIWFFFQKEKKTIFSLYIKGATKFEGKMQDLVLTTCYFGDLPLWASLTWRYQKNPHRHREHLHTERSLVSGDWSHTLPAVSMSRIWACWRATDVILWLWVKTKVKPFLLFSFPFLIV